MWMSAVTATCHSPVLRVRWLSMCDCAVAVHVRLLRVRWLSMCDCPCAFSLFQSAHLVPQELKLQVQEAGLAYAVFDGIGASGIIWLGTAKILP